MYIYIFGTLSVDVTNVTIPCKYHVMLHRKIGCMMTSNNILQILKLFYKH